MDEIRNSKDFEKVKAFKELIEKTIRELGNLSMPTQLARALDGVLPRWEEEDSDFASVLTGLKAQAWSMEAMHIQGACEKVIAHLKGNLKEIEGMLPR